MLLSIKSLYNHSVRATDGEMGGVHEFLFHDHTWDIKYMVVRTGPWLFGRNVLLAAEVLGKPDWQSQQISVNLTRNQIAHAPDISTDMPVSHQQLTRLHEHYGWHAYVESGAFGMVPFMPMPPNLSDVEQEEFRTLERRWDVHLRSSRQVTGYRLEALDAEIGHVEDFLVDDERWVICYLIVDTGKIFSGMKVLVSPKWVTAIDWGARHVSVDLTQDAVRDSPPFDPTQPVNREYETRLYDYYGRPLR